MIPDGEEKMLRDEYGYNDQEIEMVKQSRLYSKMSDDLRAQAGQSAYQRNHPQGTPEDGASNPSKTGNPIDG